MDISKDSIKAWLKTHSRDREWLAAQTFVVKKTVDNWLSSPKEIPSDKLSLISRLMQDDIAAEAQRQQQLDPVAQVFSLEVSLPEFRAHSAAAKHHGQTLEEWAIEELNRAAEDYHAARQPPPTKFPGLKEDPAIYALGKLPVTEDEKRLIQAAAKLDQAANNIPVDNSHKR